MNIHIVKLSYKSFMSALLGILSTVSVCAQTTSPIYPRWPAVWRGDTTTINAQARSAITADAPDRQRPTFRDMIFSEETPPPREVQGRRSGTAGIAGRKQNATPNSDHPLTIPHWSDSFTYQGLAYQYTMVGTDPKRGSATTVIPTVIITLRFTFEVGTPVYDEGIIIEHALT